jgi:hypothetical protein
MNIHQISRINLSPDVVDGIVFWTKNPVPMLEKLAELRDYTYYFQFTITGYGADIECNLPDKNKIILPAFKKISEIIGADRIIWRYDPIFFNPKYTFDYHIRAFGKIAEILSGYTKKVTISFLDCDYRNVKNNISSLNLTQLGYEEQIAIAVEFSKIAEKFGLIIDTCAEKIDLSEFGVTHASCIDIKLFEKILGVQMKSEKDKTQRKECFCNSAIDIGAYNTCLNGCKYCYANYNQKTVFENNFAHNPDSPLLFGDITAEDKITDRKVKSLKIEQLGLFENDC